MWFWWHDYFASKNHIVAVWVDVDYLSAEFPDRGLYLHPQDYVSFGIPAKISTVYLHGGPKKYWWRECFSIHEIGRIDGGRGFQTGKNVFRIGRNTFYDQKNKIPMKILEFKRSRIRLIVEFRGIPNGFPNQVFTFSALILVAPAARPFFNPKTMAHISLLVGCLQESWSTRS